MTSNFVKGESHTPAKSLASVGLLVYRTNSKKNLELLVRYNPAQDPREYGIPNRAPRPGEEAIDTAVRIGTDSLEGGVVDEDLDYQRSAIVENLSLTVKIRVFIAKASPQIERRVKEVGGWRGWQYTFVPLNSFEDTVWLHQDISATASSLTLLLKD